MTELFAEERINGYVRGGHRRIEGWLTSLDARLIAGIGVGQRRRGIAGAVGEIGVHHGKLFILLYLMLAVGERAFAVDVFERQQLNPDRSGQGDRGRFLANVDAVTGTAEHVELFPLSSADLDAEALCRRVGQGVRLFSIDGGHTAEITLNDLEIADRVLIDDGVIIVDDYFNGEWPGVSEGVGAFLHHRRGRLAPFAIGPNKVFLCRPDARSGYIDDLFRAVPDSAFVKDERFFGYATPIFRYPRTLEARIRQSHLYRSYRDNPVVARLKPVVLRLLRSRPAL